MTLSELFSGIADISAEISDIEVKGVTSDNREVQDGFVYVCIKGNSFDGHNVAEEMFCILDCIPWKLLLRALVAA